VAALSTIAVTGCSADQGGSGDGVTITFAYPQAGGATTWQTMADAYKEATGVTVEVEPIAIEAYAQSINTRLQGGNAPDLFLTEPGANGIGTGILNLGEAGLIGEVTESAAALINPDERAAYVVDGKALGFPLYNTPKTAVLFNENVAAAGIEWPETVDEMLALCGPTKAAGYAFTLGQYGMPFTADGQTLLFAASSVYVDDPDWDEKRAAGEVSFSDDPGWRAALQTVLDMFTSGCYQDGAEAAGGEFWAGVFAGETPKILSLSTGEADIWKELAVALPDVTFSVQPFPAENADDRRIINSVKFTLSYSAASSHQEAILDYIDWLTAPEQLQQIADLAGGVPAGELSADTLTGVHEPLAPFVENGQVASEPGLLWPSGVLAALQESTPGLLTGQKTVDQVLADLDAAWGA
jgi:raffinose/stachyose/melibiose transport system substrate-binding protein